MKKKYKIVSSMPVRVNGVKYQPGMTVKADPDKDEIFKTSAAGYLKEIKTKKPKTSTTSTKSTSTKSTKTTTKKTEDKTTKGGED